MRVLVAHDQLRKGQLRLRGLTAHDLFAQLRQRGVFGLEGLRFGLYEAKGTITVIPDRRPDAVP